VHTIYFSFYHILIFIGIFQGLLLSYIFFFNKNFRRKSSIAFGIGTLALALAGVSEIIQDLKLHEQYGILKYLFLAHFSLVMLGYYYFVIFLIYPNYQFRRKDYLILAPFALTLLLKFVIYGLHQWQPTFFDKHTSALFISMLWINYVPFFYTFLVTIWTYKELKHYHHQLLNNFSDIQGKALFWLQRLNFLVLLISIFWFFSITHMFIVGHRTDSFYILWIIVSCLIYWLAYLVILRKNIFAIPVFKKSIDKGEKNTLPNTIDEHYEKLLTLLQTEKIYQDADLNMDLLSKKMGLSNGYLSKIINQKEGKNFYEFINTYRIEEVKAHLSHPDYAHYSILGIGMEAGFKSKSTFNAVFKRMTGMTPSAYKKQL